MRVQFTFDTDDYADVLDRSVRRNALVRRLRMRNSAMMAVLIGLCAGLLIPAENVGKLIWGLFTAGLVVFTEWLTYDETRLRRMRGIASQYTGGKGMHLCSVELEESGLTMDQFGMRTTYRWPTIASVALVGNDVEIWLKMNSPIVVRGRAFRDADERQQFIDLVAGYLRVADDVTPPYGPPNS